MSFAENQQREEIVVQALNARTLPEIEAASQAVRQWMQNHPEDLSIEDVLEPLALRRLGLQAHAEQDNTVAKAS
jgi:hypothetical protein